MIQLEKICKMQTFLAVMISLALQVFCNNGSDNHNNTEDKQIIPVNTGIYDGGSGIYDSAANNTGTRDLCFDYPDDPLRFSFKLAGPSITSKVEYECGTSGRIEINPDEEGLYEITVDKTHVSAGAGMKTVNIILNYPDGSETTETAEVPVYDNNESIISVLDHAVTELEAEIPPGLFIGSAVIVQAGNYDGQPVYIDFFGKDPDPAQEFFGLEIIDSDNDISFKVSYLYNYMVVEHDLSSYFEGPKINAAIEEIKNIVIKYVEMESNNIPE